MPYLPAKDELVSLNRLSSRGLWKWYNSKVLDRRLYGVGQHFTFCRFSRKRKFFGNFDCDFRKCFTKGFFWLNMKNFEISVLTANSRYLQTAALNNCFHTAQFHFYRIINRFHHKIHQFTIHLFRAVSFRSEWIQIFDHLIQVPSLAVHGTKLFQSHCQEGHMFQSLYHFLYLEPWLVWFQDTRVSPTPVTATATPLPLPAPYEIQQVLHLVVTAFGGSHLSIQHSDFAFVCLSHLIHC